MRLIPLTATLATAAIAGLALPAVTTAAADRALDA